MSPEDEIKILCATNGLDPAKRPYRIIVKNGISKVLLSSAGYDMVAHKTGEYLGSDEVVFGPDKLFTKTIGGVLIENIVPEFAVNTVYRYTKFGTANFTAKIYSSEYLNNVSHVKNCHMFMAKWVHCVAIRLAFADVIGSNVAADEIDADMDFSKTLLGKVDMKDVVKKELDKTKDAPLRSIQPDDAIKMNSGGVDLERIIKPDAVLDVEQMIEEALSHKGKQK